MQETCFFSGCPSHRPLRDTLSIIFIVNRAKEHRHSPHNPSKLYIHRAELVLHTPAMIPAPDTVSESSTPCEGNENRDPTRVHGNLASLPYLSDELLCHVLLQGLSVEDLLRVSRASKRWHTTVMAADSAWHKHYLEAYPSESVPAACESQQDKVSDISTTIVLVTMENPLPVERRQQDTSASSSASPPASSSADSVSTHLNTHHEASRLCGATNGSSRVVVATSWHRMFKDRYVQGVKQKG